MIEFIIDAIGAAIGIVLAVVALDFITEWIARAAIH